MRILNKNQYNQGIGKYKLLSSNAGVGSIITTKLGSYALILDINKWKFIERANKKVLNIRKEEADVQKIYSRSKNEIEQLGLILVDDERFIEFLKIEKKLNSLVCLIEIPHMSLNETYNTPNWKNHPIKKALLENGESNGKAEHYMINATLFPKWFISTGTGERKGHLKEISEWERIWIEECKKHGGNLKRIHFAPPRDGNDFINKYDSKDEDGTPVKIRVYRPLNQTNLILICPNGHLSDIPWSKYLNWKLHHKNEDPEAKNLFSYSDCCENPDLIWTESKNKSEGYGSIYIHCNNCNSGKDSSSKINLEGINSIKPNCKGEKPWEQKFDDILIPHEQCDKEMRISLVTSNSVYYASGFSSLFIPMHLAENKSRELSDALTVCRNKYSQTIGKSFEKPKDQWFSEKVSKDCEEFLDTDCNIKISDLKEPLDIFIRSLHDEFVNEYEKKVVDNYENYRWQEYQCFSRNKSNDEIGLKFNDINLTENLSLLFSKIQQIEELKITQVQLDFTRVQPKDRIVRNGTVEYSKEAQNIFSENANKLFILPANQSSGEGIFFQFNEDKLDSWLSSNENILSSRFNRFLEEPNTNIQGAATMRKIYNHGIKHFLIHSFSHMIMRELEFSCGYPTASLKERLYISNNPEKQMSGVLIYTAEGSEGSMGGLVSQGEPDRISEIVKVGLERIENCSSDPLCWESEGQGIFDLNLAACFSCLLVSETACEEMNLGLDRRVLIDAMFGFFKDADL